mgnify:CR=1 FL=1
MFCRNCGAENKDGSATCTSCGEPLVNPYAASEAPSSSGMPGVKPENYLTQAILVTLCCCLPLGIVSIDYASQVDSKWNGGDYQGAMTASQNAKTWSTIAFVLGLLANIVVGALRFAAEQQGVDF